nr:SCO family protein [Methylorubrum thiocyanatum]
MSTLDGRSFDLAAERGRLVLVYFGYTRCPDVCPTTLADLSKTLARLTPDETARMRIAFVSLDPAADPAGALGDYLGSFGQRPPFVGLTGSAEAVARAAADWGVTWRRAEGGLFDHSSFVTAVDPSGRRRLRYGYAQTRDPAALARDFSALLRGV